MSLTPHHAKYFAHDLTRRATSGMDRLSMSLFDAAVDLNPHQIEAALFALQSPLSKGVILADEVGLGKTIEAGIVLCQSWAERKRRLLVICPASLRKQWALELEEKFNLPTLVLDAKAYRTAQRSGRAPLTEKAVLIMSLNYANALREELKTFAWDLVVIDEAHKLRNAYRPSNKVGQGIRWATEDYQIAFYQAPDGSVNIEVLYAEENIWLTQKKMAELFDTTPQNITQHLKNIYAEGEADQTATCKDFLQVQKEGEREVKRNTSLYSLEAIIAVGYRVSSERGAQFRQWATGILKNYIHKGYALDVNRMKYGSRFSSRYFDELYEEIKDIRTSERRIYQKITDIYATAIDYSPKAIESKEFFATVQNKLHFAITGKTAAEIITDRVNSKKEKMGLTSWRRSPQGKIMPSDTVIAKNYLDKKELEHLEYWQYVSGLCRDASRSWPGNDHEGLDRKT
jgi:hypothetical protein